MSFLNLISELTCSETHRITFTVGPKKTEFFLTGIRDVPSSNHGHATHSVVSAFGGFHQSRQRKYALYITYKNKKGPLF